MKSRRIIATALLALFIVSFVGCLDSTTQPSASTNSAPTTTQTNAGQNAGAAPAQPAASPDAPQPAQKKGSC